MSGTSLAPGLARGVTGKECAFFENEKTLDRENNLEEVDGLPSSDRGVLGGTKIVFSHSDITFLFLKLL